MEIQPGLMPVARQVAEMQAAKAYAKQEELVVLNQGLRIQVEESPGPKEEGLGDLVDVIV